MDRSDAAAPRHVPDGAAASGSTSTSPSRGAARLFALVGPGRAGMAVAMALTDAGWRCTDVAGRRPDSPSVRAAARTLGARAVGVTSVARRCDVVVIATPDGCVAEAASALAPSAGPGVLLVHLAGSLGVSVLDDTLAIRPDLRAGALHPLISIPTVATGRRRLVGSRCAVAGDDHVVDVVAALGATAFPVDDADRAIYHATAVVASNHAVALLGHLERVADAAGLPVDEFLPLVRDAVDTVGEVGAADALTGPVARGDVTTVSAHLDALPADEVAAYRSLAREALRLTEHGDEPGALDALLGSAAAPTPAAVAASPDTAGGTGGVPAGTGS
ncbi:MAG: DUF2520 domain-containing protein [Acidimicrobiia bacterium]